MNSPVATIDDAVNSNQPETIKGGLVGDLSGLSDSFRRMDFPALNNGLESLMSQGNLALSILQSYSGVSDGTITNTCRMLHVLLKATAVINGVNGAAGKEGVVDDIAQLKRVRACLQQSIDASKVLEWSPVDGELPGLWQSDASESDEVGWLERIFARDVHGAPNLNGSIFQLAMVYQHLRFLIGMDPSHEWRTVRTPVLGAEEGGSGGQRMILTVSLRPCPLQAFIPDLRYFGLTELKHGTTDKCLLDSARRCWEAAQVSGYLGVWRLEHGAISTHTDAITATHIYGRSFEAAFLCCLRAAAGNAYGDPLPDKVSGDQLDQDIQKYEREKLFEIDPLSLNTAISASLGEFDPKTTSIKDIPLAPVGGVPQKLLEASGTEISQVVFATGQWDETNIKRLDGKAQEDFLKSTQTDSLPENQSRLQWSTVSTLGAALDAVLVQSRWLKAWQKGCRSNWLRRWEKRTARAPGDDAPGEDDRNPSSTASAPEEPAHS